MKRSKLILLIASLLILSLALTSCDSIIVTVLQGIGSIKDATHEHTYLYEQKDDGTHVGTCSCGATVSEEHRYVVTETLSAATCQQGGREKVTCSLCGFQTERDTPVGDHAWGFWEVTVQPTADEKGERTRTCTVCEKAETEKITLQDVILPLDKAQYPGYRMLAEKGEAYTAAYDLLVEGVTAHNESIAFPTATVALTKEQVKLVFDCYRSDWPEHFFVTDNYTYAYNEETGVVSSVNPQYLMTAEEIPAMQTAFNVAAVSLMNGITADMTPFEKETYIHDSIVRNATYDNTKSLPYTHTAYANMVGKTSVCDGYSAAFQYLLKCVGIPSLAVSGFVGEESHAWTLVLLEDKWYQVDVTWDDPVGQDDEATGPISHEYLNLTDAMMDSTHREVVSSYTYPACTETKYHFFTFYGYTAAFSVSSVTSVFEKIYEDTGKAEFEIYLTDKVLTAEELSAFVTENKNEFFKKAKSATGKTMAHIGLSLGTTGSVILLTFTE